MSGATGLAIALFLRAIVANSTVRLTSRELFWSTVLMGGFGVVAGMALAALPPDGGAGGPGLPITTVG